ncbi:MAG TPA: glycosyltransferase family 39 protein [Patescibacteria group bacterium]|nr:glycosyltransferase family 39 protein [Patescibacteria group bacterium]
MWGNTSKIERILFILLVLLSVGTWFVIFHAGYVLTYNDAASHLNIARRVVDNLTPGLAQIGTVWLPLPHVFMLLFAWNDMLWHTAFAGSIVSMISFVVCAFFVYKTLMLLTKNKWSALIGTAIVAFNPNLLYLQSTPMTEPLFLATFTLSIYFFVRYMEFEQIVDLVLTGVCVALATLTRYDGWFLFVALLIIIPLRALITKSSKKAEGALFLFACIGGFGIALWLLWNLTIFHDALYFITGPYSAYAQQKVLRSVGQLPTQGNLLTALSYFTWSVIDNNGFILTGLSFIAVCVLITRFKDKKTWYLILALSSPFVFNIIALFTGQSAMNVPQAAANPGYFNIRYGMLVLPSIAILIGMLSDRRVFRYIAVIAISIQLIWFVFSGYPVTLTDGILGLKNTYYTVEASTWLREHYAGGLILTSLASHDAFVARAGLPMRNYIHEGTREYWQNALLHPSHQAQYIATLSYPPDVVYRALAKNPDFIKNYTLVHSYGTFGIYERK